MSKQKPKKFGSKNATKLQIGLIIQKKTDISFNELLQKFQESYPDS